jgi:hypothetical protein
VPVLFHRNLDPHQMSFAFSEAMAHVNHMLRRGELAWAPSSDTSSETGSDDVERVIVRN